MSQDKGAATTQKGKLVWQGVGTNCRMARLGDGLLVHVPDVGVDFGVSTSGKSMKVASTGGNKLVPGTDDVKIGINVFKMIPEGERAPEVEGPSLADLM